MSKNTLKSQPKYSFYKPLMRSLCKNDKENIEKSQIITPSMAKQDMTYALNLSLSSSDSESEDGSESFSSAPLPLVNKTEDMEGSVNQKPYGLGLIDDYIMENDNENIKKSQIITPSMAKQDMTYALNLSLSSSDSESEDGSDGFSSRQNSLNVGVDGKPNNKRPSCFSSTPLRSDLISVGDQSNVPKKNEEHEYHKLSLSLEEEKKKSNLIKLDLIQTEKQFKVILEEERMKWDAVEKNQSKCGNEMAKQEEKLNCIKIKIDSVHNKVSEIIEEQVRNCARIGQLEEEQKKFNFIKLEMVKTQQKLNGMAEELNLLKEENRYLQTTLKTVLARNEELFQNLYEMRSKENYAKAEYLTVQQATDLAQKVSRKEIRKYITKRNVVMKAKLKKNRSKLIAIGVKRGRRAFRKIGSEVVVRTESKSYGKVNEDDEVANKHNGEIMETQEEEMDFGANDKSNADVRVDTNRENIETVNLSSSGKVKILNQHILKPAFIKDVQPFRIFDDGKEDFTITKPTAEVTESIKDGQEKILLQCYPENLNHWNRKNDDLNPLVDAKYNSDDLENPSDNLCLNDKGDNTLVIDYDQPFQNDLDLSDESDSSDMRLMEKLPEKVMKSYDCDNDDMPIVEFQKEVINDHTYDTNISNDDQLSSDDSDRPLAIDESDDSHDDEASHLVETQNSVYHTNDLGLTVTSFKRKRSMDEIYNAQKMFALSTDSEAKPLEEENVIAPERLTYKFVNPFSPLNISVPIAPKILENQVKPEQLPKLIVKKSKRRKRSCKKKKERYIRIENAVLMLFEIPSDSMINLLLRYETKLLCKVIVRFSTEDFECKHIKRENPVAPILSEYQVVLLRLLIAMTKKDESTNQIFLEIAETAILTTKNPLHLEPIARLHVAYMKYFFKFLHAKLFIFRSLTKMGVLAIPYLYFLATSWPEVFVNYEKTSGNDRIIAKAMMKVITFRDVPEPEYYKIPLTNFLNKFYNYPVDLEPINFMLKNIIKQYMKSECDKLKNMILVIGANLSGITFFKQVLVGFKLVEIESEEKVGIAVDLLQFLVSYFSNADQKAMQTIDDWISTLLQGDYSEKMKNTFLRIKTQLNVLH